MIDTMPKKINYTLSNEELLTIERAIKNHPDLRVRERARIIRLLHQGRRSKQIAGLLAISYGQVYYWHQRWCQAGLDGLGDKPRSGRPPIGTEELKAKLEKLLEINPQDLGYAFTAWNLPRLQTYLNQEWGVTMHINTLRNLLSEMDYVYRRPKHDLGNLQDPDAKAAAQETLDELKKSVYG